MQSRSLRSLDRRPSPAVRSWVVLPRRWGAGFPPRWGTVMLGVLGVLSAAAPVRATPEYPLVLDAVLRPGMDNCPQPLSRCLICHTTARGGQGTAEQPFAVTLRPYGLDHGHDPDALRTALARLPDDKDSDDDGVPDKVELAQCDNPSGGDLGAGPTYGCNGARLAPRGEPDAALCAIGLGVAAALVRKRRAQCSS
jgi:hypothetical protein